MYSGISQRLATNSPNRQTEVSASDPIQIEDECVQPLGMMKMKFRWGDRKKWVRVDFIILPDSYFQDDPMLFDIAFSYVDTSRLTKRYPELLGCEAPSPDISPISSD
jgi:hypothetical protein